MMLRPVCHLLTLCALLLAALSAQGARPEDDTLSGGALDTCRWFDWSQNGQLAHDGRLLLQSDGTPAYGSASIASQYTLGDLSVEVDVQALQGLDAPVTDPAAQVYAGLGLYVDSGNHVLVALARTPDGLMVRTLRAAQGDGAASYDNPPMKPLAGTATRLRAERRGDRVTLSYREGSRWVTAATFGGFAAPALVTLQATNIGIARRVQAAFANVTLSADSASTHRPYLPGDRFARAGFMAGGVLTDYLYHRDWARQWRSADPLQLMAAQGMGWVRTGVTTLSVPALRSTPQAQWGSLPFDGTFWSSLEATGQVLQEAQSRGMGNVLFFYLNDSAAHAGRQGGPAAWRGLSLDDLALRVREHTAAVAAEYRARGIRIGLYEVGNETTLGLLGVAFGDRVAWPGGVDVLRDVPVLRRWLWRDQARLLKAAIAGIRGVDPQARIGVHAEGLGLSPGDLLVKAYFRTLVDEGVPFDVAGLSLPYASYEWTADRYSARCWFQRLQETADSLGLLGKRVVFSEASYPADPAGTVARPMDGFPFSAEGQALWLREHLRFANNHPAVDGFFYFYPEWKPGASSDPGTLTLQTNGLFDADERPRPALAEFALPRGRSRTDCLFDWAERQVPALLTPAGAPTAVAPPFVYRYYSGTGAYVGLAGDEPRVYHLPPGPGAAVQDLGAAAAWFASAGCTGTAAAGTRGSRR